jgi:hypothetical protein
MSEQVVIDIVEPSTVSVDVVEEGGVEVVEIIHPGPPGPPGETDLPQPLGPADTPTFAGLNLSSFVLDGGTFN